MRACVRACVGTKLGKYLINKSKPNQEPNTKDQPNLRRNTAAPETKATESNSEAKNKTKKNKTNENEKQKQDRQPPPPQENHPKLKNRGIFCLFIVDR